MKRIVNGVTYNTDTSTKLAESRWLGDDGNYFGTLYQTRGGAYFVDLERTHERWNEDAHEKETIVTHSFDPMSPDDAQKWLLEGEVEVFHNPFEDPPEAVEESEPASTIYIRVPASLKQRVDQAARSEKVSGNVWSMRCVERCLSGLPKEISKAWHLAAHYARSERPPEFFSTQAFEEIATLIEQYAKNQFGTDDLSRVEGHFLGDEPEIEEMRSRYHM